MQALELKIPPVALVFITGTLMWMLTLIAPNLSFLFSTAPHVAITLAFIGAGTALLGVREFRSVGTTVDPRVPDQSERLVVHGIYRVSRNPMYVGFLFVLGAWGIFLCNAAALVMLPVFVLYMNRFQIVPEERHMNEKFGDVFHQYQDTVRRWI